MSAKIVVKFRGVKRNEPIVAGLVQNAETLFCSLRGREVAKSYAADRFGWIMAVAFVVALSFVVFLCGRQSIYVG